MTTIGQSMEDNDQYLIELGIQNYLGFGTAKPDFDKAVEIFRDVYKTSNSTTAAFWLAKCYQYGNGVKKDFRVANKLFKIATKDDNQDIRAIAQYSLAQNYRIERGVEDPSNHVFNKTIANMYLVKAAKSGYPQAQYEAGARCLFGIDMPKNIRAGIQYLFNSANPTGKKIEANTLNIVGYAKSQELLGWCYRKGYGVARVDSSKAMAYIHSARAKNDFTAQSDLHEHLMDCDGDLNLEFDRYESKVMLKREEMEETAPTFY